MQKKEKRYFMSGFEDHNKKYMRVEFAANSDYVNWDICTDKAGLKEIEDDDELDFEWKISFYFQNN